MYKTECRNSPWHTHKNKYAIPLVRMIKKTVRITEWLTFLEIPTSLRNTEFLGYHSNTALRAPPKEIIDICNGMVFVTRFHGLWVLYSSLVVEGWKGITQTGKTITKLVFEARTSNRQGQVYKNWKQQLLPVGHCQFETDMGSCFTCCLGQPEDHEDQETLVSLLQWVHYMIDSFH